MRRDKLFPAQMGLFMYLEKVGIPYASLFKLKRRLGVAILSLLFVGASISLALQSREFATVFQ